MQLNIWDAVALLSSTTTGVFTMIFYSNCPLEQAVFDHLVECHSRIQATLAKMPANTLTSPISEHTYWIADGELLAYPAAIQEGEALTCDVLENAFAVNEVHGLGVLDLKDIVDAALEWLENPGYVTVPEGTEMIPERWRQLRKECPPPAACSPDPRSGLSGKLMPAPDFDGPSTTIAVKFHSQSDDGIIIAVEGELLKEPKQFDGEVESEIADFGYRIVGLTLGDPHASKLGIPSAFKEGALDAKDVAAHLAYGMNLSPYKDLEGVGLYASSAVTEAEEYSLIAAIAIPSRRLRWLFKLPAA
jgi:hypothetical protein